MNGFASPVHANGEPPLQRRRTDVSFHSESSGEEDMPNPANSRTRPEATVPTYTDGAHGNERLRTMSFQRSRENDSSSTIAEYLLRGWAMLAHHCPSCLSPIMRNRQGQSKCVVCNIPAVTEDGTPTNDRTTHSEGHNREMNTLDETARESELTLVFEREEAIKAHEQNATDIDGMQEIKGSDIGSARTLTTPSQSDFPFPKYDPPLKAKLPSTSSPSTSQIQFQEKSRLVQISLESALEALAFKLDSLSQSLKTSTNGRECKEILASMRDCCDTIKSVKELLL